jgi:hypothetical protein
MSNRRKFTVNAEEEKTETIQTERSSLNISQFSCFCRYFSQLKRPRPQFQIGEKKNTDCPLTMEGLGIWPEETTGKAFVPWLWRGWHLSWGNDRQDLCPLTMEGPGSCSICIYLVSQLGKFILEKTLHILGRVRKYWSELYKRLCFFCESMYWDICVLN